ncbi:collagen-binding domain-containing protein [Leifsonia flava]|uniref:Choice-of-anchor A family protein n=1 Tax=Orlajensenia leifsoniae TaxID=2561933 RepID=A0A4Y9QSG0_9MICO|nr:collagen-binding domain-containing protein [Leifsonia flava]TFV95369.1 choice-of-anchor A family protein [Leifsonia flava]
MRHRSARPIALVLAGALTAGAAIVGGLVGVVAPAAADVGPVNPVRVPITPTPPPLPDPPFPAHPANSGFLVFIEGDVYLNADESEGTLALGGDLSFGTTYNVEAGGVTPTPTFTAPGDTVQTSLYVGGGMDFDQSGGNILRVLNGGYAKVADTTTYLAHDTDQNGAAIDWRITEPGAAAESTPRIEGTSRQTPASVGTPVPSNLIDIPTAFATYRGLSTDLGTCPNTVVLTDDQGAPLASPFATGARGHLSLVPGQTNVLNITADDLSALGELAFDDEPSETTPLLVNVTGSAFNGRMPNSPGSSSAQAPFILYNFPTATTVTVTGGDSLEGTIYAPRADVRWQVTQNIEGNIIGATFTHGPGGPMGTTPREVHDFPFNAELSCSTPATQAELTLVKVVEGGDADAGDWELSAAGPTPITGASGEEAVTDAAVDPGDYTLSESGGPGDYIAGDWICDGAEVVDGVVSIEAGDDVTCTIVNTFDPVDPKLTLIKIVSGGTASPTDWVLSAAGPTPITGATGSTAVTSAEVLPGDYVLSESDGPDGYEARGWVCTGATVVGDTVTVDWGDDVSCSIINSADGGTGGGGDGGGGDGGGGDGGGTGGGGTGGDGTDTTSGGGTSTLPSTGVDPRGAVGVALVFALLGVTLLGANRIRRSSTTAR